MAVLDLVQQSIIEAKNSAKKLLESGTNFVEQRRQEIARQQSLPKNFTPLYKEVTGKLNSFVPIFQSASKRVASLPQQFQAIPEAIKYTAPQVQQRITPTLKNIQSSYQTNIQKPLQSFTASRSNQYSGFSVPNLAESALNIGKDVLWGSPEENRLIAQKRDILNKKFGNKAKYLSDSSFLDDKFLKKYGVDLGLLTPQERNVYNRASKVQEERLMGAVMGATQPIKKAVGKEVGKFAGNINLSRLKLTPEEKVTLTNSINAARSILERAKGKKLSNQEVIQAAKTSDILTKVTTREQTLQANATMLKARQNMVTLDKNLDNLIKSGNTGQVKKTLTELVDSLRVVSSEAADRGRKLQSLSIEAGEDSLRASVLKDISKVEQNTDKIVKAAEKVDWNNANSITNFYREFVKPSLPEILDEFRYNNLLSNPLTHLRNIYSNVIQTTISRPLTLVASGKPVEALKLLGGELKAVPKAFKAFGDSFSGKSTIEKPDLTRISTNKLPKLFTVPSRAMEAADQFFQTLLKEGELARGATAKEAESLAKYTVFRRALDPKNASGQGNLLSAIDNATSGFYEFGRKFPALRWFVPFVQTPMSVAKQWIEYSPAGFATVPGAVNKREQIAKALVGSVVTAMGAQLAVENRTSWLPPTNPKEKELFYASGKKPFSVKVGDMWVPMPFLGIFAFPVALAAATKHYQEDSKTALTDDQLKKLSQSVFSMTDYFSQQTFMEGLGNFVSLARGDKDYSLSNNLAFTASQAIPLSGLVGYVSRLVDPVYRKSEGFVENIQKSIPFASQGLPAYENPLGEPSTRNLSNYVAPYGVGIEDPRFTGQLEGRSKSLQSNAVLNSIDNAIEEGKTPKGDPVLIELRKAEYSYSKIKNSPKDQKDAVIKELESKGLLDSKIYEQIMALKQYDKRGISKEDREVMLFKNPTVKAQRILNRLNDFKSKESRQKHLDKLRAEGIVNDEIIAEMLKLKNSK